MTPSSPIFPPAVPLESFDISAFQNAGDLIRRILFEIERPGQRFIAYLNVHVANMAEQDARLADTLRQADCLFCDGAGIQLGAWMMGGSLPKRFPAADWVFDLLASLAESGRTVYFLGGKPGVFERMRDVIAGRIPNHTVIGGHHGYFLTDEAQERAVIDDINALRPDLLIVGFGTPLQERWIAAHREQLRVSALLPLGAVMDYFTGAFPRCPQWMGDLGMEWLFRLSVEPRRLFARYVVGNPQFLTRMAKCALQSRLLARRQRPAPVN
ncbi:MAG: WecB/TagA/CpsF family glycosyltransferase [Vampirovibrionales bacterium]|nr:WecB/TagA/CpsF family glycosyltransferase [Vampirovibrionales bacterium]